jgi:hypothetical protein
MGGHSGSPEVTQGRIKHKGYEDTVLGKGRVTVCIGCGGGYLTQKYKHSSNLSSNIFYSQRHAKLKKEGDRKQTKVTFRKIKHDIFLASSPSPQVISNEVLQFETMIRCNSFTQKRSLAGESLHFLLLR